MSTASMGNVDGIRERRGFSARAFFARWEWVLFFLIIVVFMVNASIAPYFLRTRVIFDMTFNFIEKGIIALLLSFIIITGQIDISVASNMAMSAVIASVLFQSGMNIWIATVLGLVVGTVGGFINGYIITKVKIHSMIVTLATLSLYRGIAYVLLGDKAVTGLLGSCILDRVNRQFSVPFSWCCLRCWRSSAGCSSQDQVASIYAIGITRLQPGIPGIH